MIASLSPLDWPDLMAKLQSFASSDIGRNQLSKTDALPSEGEALRSCREISDFHPVITSGQRPRMESLDLSASWFLRLEKQAVLKTLEIKDIRFFCEEITTLKEVLSEQAEDLRDIGQSLISTEPILSAIDQLMTMDGEIRNDASETLYRLHREKQNLNRQIENSLSQLVKDQELESILQDRFVTNREGRWVVPVKSGRQHDFVGIIHGSSQSKQTVFMEPQEITPMNNRLRQVEVEIQDEIDFLLQQLSDFLFSHLDEFRQAHATLVHCDVRLAQAQLAQVLQATPPKFSEDKIQLNGLFHPLLSLGQDEVVKNSVHLNPQKNTLLLSGPNAGGKTVLLKSLGLAAQMARCGLPICAESGSSLPFFRALHIAVGDEQSVDQKLSTFAAHLKTLNQSVFAKGPQQLILIDEICGSTDPEEGSALARSFIERYGENGVFSVITSHLGPLKSHWPEDSPVLNGSLDYDQETGKPTYQFIPGVPGHSQALQTARRVGVAEEVLQRAYHLLSPETKDRLEKLDEVEKLRQQLQKLQRELRQATQQAHRQKEKFQSWLSAFKKEKENRLERIVKRAERKMDDLVAKAKVDDVFKRHERNSQIKDQFPKVVKKEGPRSLSSPEEFARQCPPGSSVHVASLGKNGVVQSTPNSKGLVQVQAASMRVQIPWRELSEGLAKTATVPTRSHRDKNLSQFFDQPNVIDLRGKTVDEAIEELEVFLDRSIQQHSDRIKVIHGHGTQSLKKAVRSHLSRSVYVHNWSAGQSESGGDGITWVELKQEDTLL